MKQWQVISLTISGITVVGLLMVWVKVVQYPGPQKFIVGYQPTALYLPHFIAAERGFFKEQGLDVQLQEFQSANEMAQAFVAGHINATGMSSITVLAQLEASRPGLFKMYLFETLTRKHHPDFLIVRKGSGIKSLADLKGKKLGVHPGTTMRTYARMILSRYLNPDSDVTIIELSPAIQVQAIAAGQVDALLGLEPMPTIAVNKGLAEVLVAGPLARYVHEPLLAGSGIISTHFLKRNPDIVKRFIKALEKSLDFIQKNPKEARLYLTKYTPLEASIAEKVHLVEWIPPDEVDVKDLKAIIKILYQHREIDREVDLSGTLLKWKELTR